MREHSGESFCAWDCGGTLVGADPLIGLSVFPMTRVDVGIDPYEFFRGFQKSRGDSDRRESPEEGAVSNRQSAQIEELSLRASAHTGVAIPPIFKHLR